jgi:hypothetical protein
MQKFGFLNDGFFKNAFPCGFHLQYLFPVCHRHCTIQVNGISGTEFHDTCDGFFYSSRHQLYRVRLAVYPVAV